MLQAYMNKLGAVLLILFGMWNPLFAQRAGIQGVVLTSTNEPVVGANVVLKGTVRAAQTNAKGEYLIKGLVAGKYSILVSMWVLRIKRLK